MMIGMETPELNDAKGELRRRMKAERVGMTPEERRLADERIRRNVDELGCYQRAAVVATYLSFGTEVDTRGLIVRAWDDGKQVAVPYCVSGTRTMRWYYLRSFNGLIRSSFGVEEPDPQTFEEAFFQEMPSCEVLAVVPGLAFDRNGYRLGYGAGYYDVFLSGFEGSSLGLCRRGFLLDDLGQFGAIDAHDVPVHRVVCDEGLRV